MAKQGRKLGGDGGNTDANLGGDNGATGQTPGQLAESVNVGGVNNDANGTTSSGDNGTSSGQGINPGDLAGQPLKRKRGRPPGSGNKSGGAATSKVEVTDKQAIGALAGQIQGLHIVLATLTKSPIFVLAPQECEAMAGAIHNVGKHYNLDLGGPRAAIIQLIAVAGGIYMPRLVAIGAARAEARRQNSATVRVPPGPEETAPPVPDGGVIDFEGAAFTAATAQAANAGRQRR